MKPITSAKIIDVKSSWAKPTKKTLWGKAKFKNCCYCEMCIPIKDVTQEHLIPRSGGGTLIAACCLECNRSKGAMLLIDWVIKLYDDLRKEGDVRKVRRIEVKIKNSIKYLLLLYPGEYDFIF
jgi:5-methylcytosine-specific restriction endonuclease McrA